MGRLCRSFKLCKQFIKSEEVREYPRMIMDLPNEEWQKFFLGEAGKLKPDIVK